MKRITEVDTLWVGTKPMVDCSWVLEAEAVEETTGCSSTKVEVAEEIGCSSVRVEKLGVTIGCSTEVELADGTDCSSVEVEALGVTTGCSSSQVEVAEATGCSSDGE